MGRSDQSYGISILMCIYLFKSALFILFFFATTPTSWRLPGFTTLLYAKHKMTNAIIIGAGPSGIAMAHKLKQKLGFDDFMVCCDFSTFHRLFLQYLLTTDRSMRNWMERVAHGEPIYTLDGEP